VVGLATEIGRGESELEKVDRVLGPEPIDGPDGVAPAPAEPLVLWDVAYDWVSFRVDEEAAESARAVWRQRHRERAAAARVAGVISDGLE
jgi:tRNA pseudouridine38-40 synthase